MIHLLDTRRRRGRIIQPNGREDGGGFHGQIEQYPVICSIDFVEQEVTMRSRAEQVVTEDPRFATCPECRERIGR